MALVLCKECKAEMSPKAASCPKCGHPNKEANYLSGGQVLVTFLVLGGVIWWLVSSAGSGVPSVQISTIDDKVAVDAVAQYDIAKRQGDAIQVCVAAGFVSAAYLQAKNEAAYRSAREIEQADCKRAGTVQ